jgi:hypothetical protein
MNTWTKFWAWYERHYALNLSITAGLFLLQLVHLYWLFGSVICVRLFGVNLFPVGNFWQFIIIVVDYTEIPALIASSVLYLDELRKGYSQKALVMLLLLNSQWLHLFWITDEFVITAFTNNMALPLPDWLAWVAILIDYLEVPVIVDILRKTRLALKEHRFEKINSILKEED